MTTRRSNASCGVSLRLALGAQNPVAATGMALLAAGALFVIGHMHVYGWARGGNAEDGALSSVEFYRAELTRQRDLQEKVWLWYLLPLAPGVALLLAARARAHPLEAALSAAGAIAVALVITWVNPRAAQRLQRDIDALRA